MTTTLLSAAGFEAWLAGLVFDRYAGHDESARQVQVSGGMLFAVRTRYDPENLLAHQVQEAFLQQKLDRSSARRLTAAPRMQHQAVTTPPGVPEWAGRINRAGGRAS